LFNAPTPAPSFIILYSLGSYRVDKQTHKHIDKPTNNPKTSPKTSNVLRYATTLGNSLMCMRSAFHNHNHELLHGATEHPHVLQQCLDTQSGLHTEWQSITISFNSRTAYALQAPRWFCTNAVHIQHFWQSQHHQRRFSQQPQSQRRSPRCLRPPAAPQAVLDTRC